MNTVRREFTTAGNRSKLRAFVRDDNNTPLTPGTAATAINVIEEFGQLRHRQISPSLCTITIPMGSDPLDPDDSWTPAIDGDFGYNCEVLFKGDNLEFEALSDEDEPSVQGFYRVIVEFGDYTQEFELSVRA